MSDVVGKLWGFCHTLRHDGIDYGDYIEQITYLLFIKMADERGIDLADIHYKDDKKKRGEDMTQDCSWPTLSGLSGTTLTEHYIDVLRALGKQRGLLGDIFGGAQSRFNAPVNLKKLIGLIDETEWTGLEVDVKAAAFEGLLEKAAAEGKKGAGQYFTPRLLIQSIVRCMKPDPRAHKEFTICDPACGTAGFLMCAYEWLMGETDELLGEERLASLKRDKAEVEKALEDATREPQFRVNLYHRHLLDFLRDYFPGEADQLDTLDYRNDGTLFAQSLSRLAGKARERIEQEIAAATEQRDAAQDAIDSINGRIRQIDDDLDLKDALYSLETSAKIEVNPELTARNRQRQYYETHKNTPCPWSGIMINACPVVVERQQILSMSSVHDAYTMEQAEARKAEEIKKIELEKAEMEERRSRLQNELQEKREARRETQDLVRDGQSRHRDLARIQKEYERWVNWKEKPEEYSALKILREKKQALDAEITKTEQNLEQALMRHSADCNLLSSIFSYIVKTILPGSRHDGKVLLDKGEISFRITRGSVMSGEAISTIAVLWADLAALILNCVSDKSRHPGILIHDSPREADLALSVYHSFINFAGSIQDSFSDDTLCPFQYIVTTTTEPPENYREGEKYLKLPLDASDINGLLLQCDVDANIPELFSGI